MTSQAWTELFIGIATIIAIIAGPIGALRIQRTLDQERDVKNRKLQIFKTLMTFRATRLAPMFVQALNSIDLEFTKNSEKPICDAWKELQDHYNDWGLKTSNQKKDELQTLTERATDLLANLLVAMGQTLDYSFDKVYVKKGCYYPEGLGNIEQEQHAVRKGLLNILTGNGLLPVAVFEQKFAPLAAQAEVRELPLERKQLKAD